jgi:hypothetical protein
VAFRHSLKRLMKNKKGNRKEPFSFYSVFIDFFDFCSLFLLMQSYGVWSEQPRKSP